MLSKLRLKLTLLYLLASALFIVLIGAGLYVSLHNYFQSTTDLALKYRLVLELRRMNQPVPESLAGLKYVWNPPTATPAATLAPTSQATATVSPYEQDDEEYYAPPLAAPTLTVSPTPIPTAAPSQIEPGDVETSYEGELAAVFIMPVDPQGSLISDQVNIGLPIIPDRSAIEAAINTGIDLRSEKLADGSEVRLLTYKMPATSGVSALQLGRLMSDQQRLLNQYWLGIIIIGTISLLLMGLGSWWLAGRSIRPAQEAMDRQQAFVANASHELRTPLTLIHSSADLARQTTANIETRQYLDDVVADTNYMSRMVEDLLLLSRLDAKKLTLSVRAVQITPIFQEIETKAARLVKPKGISFSTQLTNLRVKADAERLTQVLWVLITNAIEHTPENGSIRLSAKDDGRNIAIEVRDTGSGISARVLPHIFERFFRGEHPSEDRGAGLGLSIAKGLVEAMKGRITAESKVGEGTIVKVILGKG